MLLLIIKNYYFNRYLMKLIQIITSITLCIALLAQDNTFALQPVDLTNHMDSSDLIVVPVETENLKPENLPEQKPTYLSQFKQFIAKSAVKYIAIALTTSLVLYTGAVYTNYASSPMSLWNSVLTSQKKQSQQSSAKISLQQNSSKITTNQKQLKQLEKKQQERLDQQKQLNQLEQQKRSLKQQRKQLKRQKQAEQPTINTKPKDLSTLTIPELKKELKRTKEATKRSEEESKRIKKELSLELKEEKSFLQSKSQQKLPKPFSTKQILSIAIDPQVKQEFQRKLQPLEQQKNKLLIDALQTSLSITEQILQILLAKQKKIKQNIDDLTNEEEINELLRNNKCNNEQGINDYFSTELQKIESDITEMDVSLTKLGKIVEYENEVTEYKKRIDNIRATTNTLKTATRELPSQLLQKRHKIVETSLLWAKQQLSQSTATTTTTATTTLSPHPSFDASTYADQFTNVPEQNKKKATNNFQEKLDVLKIMHSGLLTCFPDDEKDIISNTNEYIQNAIQQIASEYQ